MKRKLLLLFTAISAATFSFSQNYLGVASSNYAGVMGLDVNPASFVDGRFKFDMNLASVNVGLWNNARYFDTKDMPNWWVKSFKTNTGWMKPDSTFANRYVGDLDDYNNPKKSRGLYSNYQIDLLNFAFHITPKIAVGFSAKSRMVANIDNLDSRTLKLVENGLDFSDLWNLHLNDKLLNLNAMAWNEYGINYGQVVVDNGANFLKVGGRVKLLQGLGSAYMYTDNVGYQVTNDTLLATVQGNFKYGYSQAIDDYANGATFDPFRSNSKLGFGLDLGVVYEWRPNWKEYKYEMDGVQNIWRQDQDKYKIRVGASILDIGGMKFTKGGLSRDFSVNTSILNLHVFDQVNSFGQFDTIVDSLTHTGTGWTTNENAGKTYYMNTPTALSLQFDYHIYKWFYVNATGMLNILGKKVVSKVHVPNQVVITPSFDYAWFGLHVPISINNYSGFKAGLAARLGPLTIGFTDWRSILASGKVRGTEFYAGLRLPILYGAPRDRDNDKVSDRMDNCIDTPGVWAFKGCPDTDGDGIQDSEDLCPTEAGLAEFKGCPDRDGDKIPDKDDECPDTAGLAYFKGCPDTDGDSIPDPKDECADVPGIAAFNGCPDTDGDGLKDSDDACPDNAGPIANQGCPDTDNDGIFDFLDNCPLVFGPKENNGCPWPDTDGDGLLDKDDECPNLAGPVKNNGCPYKDTDEDGVLDKDDECPTVKGPADNKGCPKLAVEEQEILNTAFENLEFNTGNAIIKESSFASLNELADLLQKKPTWKLSIAGHTDNVGDDQKNMILSKQRAEAVKTYLAGKGIDQKRMITSFFGETKPIASNDTPEGRQKNRRVEMKVIFE